MTRQTAKTSPLGKYITRYDDEGKENIGARNLEDQVSVEIEYTQVSTFKTIDPTFADVTYVIQEPFATTVSRYEYIAFLRLLSSEYLNVTSVSPVILPPDRPVVAPPSDASPPPDGETAPRASFGVLMFAGGMMLIFSLQLVHIYFKRKRRKDNGEWQDAEELGSEDDESEIEGEGGKRNETCDTLSAPGVHRSRGNEGGWDPNTLARSFNTYATRESMTRSTCSEVVIDVVVPPGRVGCVIDSSPRRGPYICEIHEFSPLREELQLGDRLLAVDDEDVRGMSAVDVSRLLGSRSLNEERVITVLREFFYDVSADDGGGYGGRPRLGGDGGD